jgi:putative ABC transport system substrate-binding protein
MDRRGFLTALGGATLWPVVARAQPMPVIGFLSSGSPRAFAPLVTAFGEGLKMLGYAHGRDVWIDYRWAEGHYSELPALAAELARRQVTLIAATGGAVSAQAAIKATTKIPIVFVVGFDPVQLGLVASLSRPAANATGVSIFTTELAAKRLEVLHDLLPRAHTIAILVNPGSVATTIEVEATRAAARVRGLTLVTIEAASESAIDAAFARTAEQQPSALLVSADPFFTSRHVQLVALAARYALPAMYPFRLYVKAGGLLSYGTELTWAYQQAGIYAGRILKGGKTTELPVMQPTHFNLVLNRKTARELGIPVSDMMLARAHEVIEDVDPAVR